MKTQLSLHLDLASSCLRSCGTMFGPLLGRDSGGDQQEHPYLGLTLTLQGSQRPPLGTHTDHKKRTFTENGLGVQLLLQRNESWILGHETRRIGTASCLCGSIYLSRCELMFSASPSFPGTGIQSSSVLPKENKETLHRKSWLYFHLRGHTEDPRGSSL